MKKSFYILLLFAGIIIFSTAIYLIPGIVQLNKHPLTLPTLPIDGIPFSIFFSISGIIIVIIGVVFFYQFKHKQKAVIKDCVDLTPFLNLNMQYDNLTYFNIQVRIKQLPY